MVLTVDHVADAADRQADHRPGAAGVDDLPETESCPPGPHVGADHGAEQAAPLADPALGQGEDAQPLAVGKDLEVLPYIKETGSDEAEHDHPGQPVACVPEVDAVLLEEPEAQARRRDDPEHREHAVPGDQQRADADDVRVQVDDDREQVHWRTSAARSRRDSATCLGSRASV